MPSPVQTPTAARKSRLAFAQAFPPPSQAPDSSGILRVLRSPSKTPRLPLYVHHSCSSSASRRLGGELPFSPRFLRVLRRLCVLGSASKTPRLPLYVHHSCPSSSASRRLGGELPFSPRFLRILRRLCVLRSASKTPRRPLYVDHSCSSSASRRLGGELLFSAFPPPSPPPLRSPFRKLNAAPAPFTLTTPAPLPRRLGASAVNCFSPRFLRVLRRLCVPRSASKTPRLPLYVHHSCSSSASRRLGGELPFSAFPPPSPPPLRSPLRKLNAAPTLFTCTIFALPRRLGASAVNCLSPRFLRILRAASAFSVPQAQRDACPVYAHRSCPSSSASRRLGGELLFSAFPPCSPPPLRSPFRKLNAAPALFTLTIPPLFLGVSAPRR